MFGIVCVPALLIVNTSAAGRATDCSAGKLACVIRTGKTALGSPASWREPELQPAIASAASVAPSARAGRARARERAAAGGRR